MKSESSRNLRSRCLVLPAIVLAVASGCVGGEDSDFSPDTVRIPFCADDPDAVEALFQAMTPRMRIGQHLVTSLGRKGQGVDEATERRLRRFGLGGGFVAQVSGIAQGDNARTARFLHHAQAVSLAASGVPLLVATDQEGGVYSAFNHRMGGTDNIGPAAIGATGDPRVAFEQFDLMGREIKALGIHADFGPLLDTHYQRDNGNLNTRTFGPDVALNARLGVAACLGLQRNLVLPFVKHFPGDGMTAGNTHHEFVVNRAPLPELEYRLLPPFVAAFEGGCDGVMIIPARYDALDATRSAVTSRPVVTDYLRGSLGFDGLVVTDDLGMHGARQGLEAGAIPGLEALKAGADLLLYVSVEDDELDALVSAVEDAVDADPVFAAALDASTRRILRHKQKYCLLQRPLHPEESDVAALPSRVGLPQDAERSRGHADRAVVLMGDDGVLPLAGRRVLCVGPAAWLPDPASGWSWVIERSFCEALRTRDPSVGYQDFIVGATEESAVEWAEENAADADVVVVATFQAWFDPGQQLMLDRLLGLDGLPVVHVALGVPFDWIHARGRAAAGIALLGGLPGMFDAGAGVLFGDVVAAGTMRWDLND